jgi:CRISPR system Cascade subunit CasA
MPHFNLVDEPWIPCLMREGNTQQDLSLKEVFSRAPEIREIYDPSPLVTVSIHRLLLAILHRNFGPRNRDAWRELWGRGEWNMEQIEGYFATWHHRFDLFDEDRPFYQVPFMHDTDSHSAAALALELVAGNSPLIFNHSIYHNVQGSARTIPPARAAHLLLVRQGYSIGFGKSQPFYFVDGHLTRGFTVLVTGDTLFETLALNLMPYNEQRPLEHNGEDSPAWEQDSPAIPERQGTVPRGYLDYLTWQSRRIHLIPNGDGTLVERCQIRQNLVLAEGVLDPFKSYKRDETRGFISRGLQSERAIWRDSHALFEGSDPKADQPEVFRWLARVEDLRRLGRIDAQEQYNFGVFGFNTEERQPANIILWRHERLPLPLRYLQAPDLLGRLKDALAQAEQVNGALIGAIGTLAALLLKPDANDEEKLAKAKKDKRKYLDNLIRGLAPARRYWSQLEPHALRLLVALADDRTEDEEGDWVYGRTALPEWTHKVQRAARDAFRETTASLDTSARALRAVARAEREFERRLRGIIGERDRVAGARQEGETVVGEVVG